MMTKQPNRKATRTGTPPKPTERVSLDPLDPVTALRALLAVDPEAEPSDEAERADEAGAEPTAERSEPKRADA